VSKKKDIAIAASLAAILAVYAFGFLGGAYMPKYYAVLYNLYYISIASTVYGFSLVMFMLSNGLFSKVVSCIWLGVSSAALYTELFLDPTNWTWWSAGLVVFVSVNLFLSISIIEKIKSNGSNRNHK